MSQCTFRYSKPSDEAALREILIGSKMQEKNLNVEVKISGTVSEALSHDRMSQLKMIVFEDADQKIVGMASLTEWSVEALSRIGLTAKAPVLYLGDLRIKPDASREVRLEWKSQYRKLIDELAKESILLTSILDENRLAQLALRRGKEGIHYEPVFSYTTATVLNLKNNEASSTFKVLKNKDTIEVSKNGHPEIGAKFRTGLKRSWVFSTAEQKFGEDSIVLKDLNSSNHLVEILTAASMGSPVQLCAKNDSFEVFRNSLQDTQTIYTPATLYQVSSISTPVIEKPTSIARDCIDITIL